MATRPELSVLIATKGRESLYETLDSIPSLEGIEVVMVADGAEAEERARWAVANFWRMAHWRVYREDESCWGHPQRNRAMAEARGRWLCFIDDDDLYTPEAFTAFRKAMRRRRPTMFRMTYQWKDCVLWNEPRVAHCNVGTPMILTPNDPARLGVWPHKRTGDFDFIRDTIDSFGGCTWDQIVICTVRQVDQHPTV